MIEQIEELLDEQIRPALASHGGNVELIDIDNNKVFIKFKGGCQGCSSSTATLKNGLERILKKEYPFIEEVVDVTNHAQGENPYM